MKKRVLFFTFIFMLIFPQVFYGATLSYWYSNSNKIGKDNNRNIWSRNIDGFSSADFNSYISHARSQWSPEGINTFGSNDKSSSSIHWYGGNHKTLEELEPSLSYLAAVCVITYVSKIGNHTYNGTTKENWKITSVIYTPKKPLSYLYTAKNYRSMFTHELGHALGWIGHSSTSSDLMYGSTSRDTLTTRDSNHLKQNY